MLLHTSISIHNVCVHMNFYAVNYLKNFHRKKLHFNSNCGVQWSKTRFRRLWEHFYIFFTLLFIAISTLTICFVIGGFLIIL